MSESAGQMIVVTGPPGAGKSTVARLIAEKFDPSVVLVGDDFHHFIRTGYIPPWSSESQHQNEVVISATAASAAAYAIGGYCAIVDGIIGPWFVQRWLNHVPDEVPVHYVILRPTPEIARQRAIGRSGAGDLVDSGPIGFMHREFSQSSSFDEHVLDSSDLSPEETAVEVIRLVTEGKRRLRSP